MTDIASLGIKIDASDADAAALKLDRLAAAAARAEAGGMGMGRSIKSLNASMREVDAAASVGTAGLTGSRKATA